ncbi:Pam17-domain-containing protein [Viridothelium virens]|uniref:Presequence translocated-associated motor subunit PAM17 n=1 Tax=Viridothelium virens TaxID=1048519 RepID=A0A6A6HMU5_VIRVR|nr:Pam17-domain-containing protein [Viridothelium virens]
MASSKAALSTTAQAPSLSNLSSRTCLRLRPSTTTTSTTCLASPAWTRPHTKPHPLSIRKFTTTSPTTFFSTSLRSNPTVSASPITNTSSTSPLSPPRLPWHEFFRLRKRRRQLTLSSSVVGSALFFYGGVSFLSTFDLADVPGAATLGLDPFILLGLETFGFAVVGWLAGPVAGEALFRVLVVGGRGAGEFQAKEREFFARIKKHRADPANSSVQNPVPDYYGEKISGVKDYRRWLKDQRAFNLKRQKNLL